MTAQDVVSLMYADYRARYGVDGLPPFGDCQIIAALVCIVVPNAEPVGGICSDAEDSGAHWWSELPDGTVLDPLGADWQAGGVTSRDPQVRGVPALLYALRRTWPDEREVLALADNLEAKRKGGDGAGARSAGSGR